MSGTPDMREYILDVAAKLFYQHGLRAIGVDRVISEAGIAKATLYRHFPAKEQLMVAYLKRRSEAAIRGITTELDSIPGPPAAHIEALFDRLARVMDGEFRGCAFIRAMSEHLESEAIRDQVIAHKNAVRELIGGLMQSLPLPDTAKDELVDCVSLLYEGALSMGLVYQQGRSALAAKRAALAQLAIACETAA